MPMEGEVNEYLNALREELMKVFPPLPPKGTPYYYIRALPQPEKFGVCGHGAVRPVTVIATVRETSSSMRVPADGRVTQ